MKGNYIKPSELLRLQRETGKSYWDLIGRPLYDEGKDVEEEPQQTVEDPNVRAALEYAINMKLDAAISSFDEGKDVAGSYNFNAIPQISPNAGLSYENYYDKLTGDVFMDANSKIPTYNKGKNDPVDTFVRNIGPKLYLELLRNNVANIDTAYNHMLRQLGAESAYGTSNVARKNHNYGGVGWNGKRYFSYDSDEAFIKDYVKLMLKRYNSAINAQDIKTYAKALKDKGYYEDTLENYTANLVGMKSLSRLAEAHKNSNPDLYKLSSNVKPIELMIEEAPKFQPQVVKYPLKYTLTPQQAQYNSNVPEYINKDAGVATWPRSIALPNIINEYNKLWQDSPVLKPTWRIN